MDLDGGFHHERDEQIVPKVLCCMCGLLVDSNPSNMCPSCLRSHVDITESLQKEYIIVYCPECARYLQPPQYWSHAELESRELLTICLKRIKGMSRNVFKLVDAGFIWTEPHSKRLKVKLVLQKEVLNNIVIQQACVVEYVVLWQQCPTCQKVATGQPQWDACVQARQKATHKKTFLFIEQLILKHKLHESFVRVESQPDGLDFFFAHKSHAMNFLEFLNRNSPITRRDAVQLVSHDSKNNTAVQHHTFSVEIASLCREDLLLLPYQNYYLKLGGLGPLVIVHKVYSSIVLLDPKTLRAGEFTGQFYWKKPFSSIMSSRELTEFYVLECTPTGVTNGRYQLGIVTVCLSAEVGQGREWIVTSHLGGMLQPGDLAMGYLLEGKNFNNEEWDSQRYKPEQLQDVVLVRKHFPAQKARRHRRVWKLKHLDVVDPVSVGRNAKRQEELEEERREFEDELERDAEFRRDVPIYKMSEAELAQRAPVSGIGGREAEDEDEADKEAPEIALEEMLDELRIEDDALDAADDGAEDVDAENPKKRRRAE
ncbi:nonsense-mediated mRNA decay protein 3 [Trypanosoma conorhini]|uniref:60S ribosomal export protein NMD3 n=1 Tax=Trypanosoma conorhini TaxID=83891 RepID=A0A3R7K126_9TRYP|nr:nonsense-mediated mRNA decay protein 3 [Trypanosoma conorhini]RNE99946.1 nonsense-mediated mRNA decay protein 3 [Trypanosoma conorhini]